MAIAAGTRFNHYEILAPLGAGGMGEVWRARDTRLNCEVAIKVLPADFANDTDRLQRFEQEARATSALNHPNILTVHDFGLASPELGRAPHLVAELLEGEELRAELEHGALAPRKAIEYAQQIAAGFAAAHEKGVVLMSDGLPERFNPQGEMLDYERIFKVLPAIAQQTTEEIIIRLTAMGDEWSEGRPQDDDETFVVLKFRDETSRQ